jgi:PP-loop superfamily ATP-utilizing enzyme
LHGTEECIGFTTDELQRTERPALRKKKWKVRFPLIEYGLSESDCLSYCKSLGYTWDGLYDVFSRVSCFCCPKAGEKRIDKLKTYFPELYEKFLHMCEIAGGRPSFK